MPTSAVGAANSLPHLIIPRSISKREFRRPSLDKKIVLRAWVKGIPVPLPGKDRPGCTYLKYYSTTTHGPRRILLLQQTGDHDVVLLLYRAKGDSVGDNMAHSNPDFKTALLKALALADRDIAAGEYDCFPKALSAAVAADQ